MTISQNIIRLQTTFSDNLFNVKNKIFDFVKNHAQKISAISMAGKMLFIATFMAVLPIGTTPVKVQNYDTQITFDKNNPVAALQSNKTTKVELGESDFNRAEREKNQVKIAYEPQNITVSSHSDPSDFRAIYMAAGAQFGVPWQIIEAVHEVETGKSGSTGEASYAGATGPMQFMPGTWRTYQVDGNGDGNADITDVSDAIYGAANLLAQSGAAEGNIDGALFNYNHAQWYVNKVKAIAYEIGM